MVLVLQRMMKRQGCWSRVWHDCPAPDSCFVVKIRLVSVQTEADPEAVQAGCGWMMVYARRWLLVLVPAAVMRGLV